MKIFKWISIIIVALILLCVVAAICLVTLVSPNQFKSLIENKMETTLGRKLTIEGDLSWTFFPNFGIKAGHVILNNPLEFQQKIFAEVDRMTVGVKIFSLWNKKIESNGITIEGMKLYLIKNTKGAVNWSFQKKSDPENLPEQSNNSSDPSSDNYSFTIQALNVKDAEIFWINESHSESLNFKNFNLKAKDITQLHPFSIDIKFDFYKNKQSIGHLNLSGDMSLDTHAKIYTFRKIDSHFKTSKNIDYAAKGAIIMDLKRDTLELSDFAINTDFLKTKGLIHINNLTKQLSMNGNVDILFFDIKSWLKQTGSNITNIEIEKNATGELNFNFNQSFNAQGKLNFGDVKVGKLLFNQLNLLFNYNGKDLNISNMTAHFYQGELSGNALIDLNQSIPEITFNTKISNFDATALMQALGAGKLKFTGKGNFNLSGKTLAGNTFIKNLNGVGDFRLSGGVLQGIDIAFLVKSVGAKKLAANDLGQTPFGNVTGNFTINHGVVTNPNLNIDSPDFATKGQGKIDLVNQTIFYHLQTSVNASLIDLKGLTVPILVSGNLKNPSIGIDMAELAKQLAKQQLKKITDQGEINTKTKVEIPKNAGKIIKNLFGH